MKRKNGKMKKMKTMTISELEETIRALPEDEILRVTFEEEGNGGEEI